LGSKEKGGGIGPFLAWLKRGAGKRQMNTESPEKKKKNCTNQKGMSRSRHGRVGLPGTYPKIRMGSKQSRTAKCEERQ